MKAVRIPRRMASLPRDPRGYPIPVIVWRDPEGRPHFTINSEAQRAFSVIDGTCSICGQPLLLERWFVGGPVSAFDPNGAYADPPMHRECLHYALRVCPYLAAPNYGKRIDMRTVPAEHITETRLMIDTTQDPDRPKLFVAVGSNGTLRGGPRDDRLLSPYVRPRRPYNDIEFWQAGRQLRTEIGLRQLTPEHRAAARDLLRRPASSQ
jgi:hypothetical protein